MRPAFFLPFAAAFAATGCGERRAPPEMTPEEVAEELAGMRIEPGLWELTSDVVEVSAPDLPREVRNRMIGPRQRIRNCVTPALAERPEANFLAIRADSECTYRDFSIRDGRLQGLMSCPDATARMEGQYGPEAYDLSMRMETPLPGGQAKMVLELRARGRRIGECEEGASG